MKRWHAAALALGLLAPAARAQFSLCPIPGLVLPSPPAKPSFVFASAYPDMPEAVEFCAINTTSQTQTLALLSVSGVGFSLTGATAPVSVPAGNGVQFTVTFQYATVTKHNSGTLNLTGVLPVSLSAAVVAGPTYEVQATSGAATVLGAAGVNFGSVQLGSNALVNFEAVNRTSESVTVDSISVTAGDFALVGTSPSGTALETGESATFSIQFSPTADGTRTAVLSIGAMQFTLTGTGTGSALPPFSLYQNTCGTGQPVGAAFSFPAVYPNTAEPATFCLLNNTSSTQTVSALSVSGVGFSLAGATAPLNVPAGDSVQFTVTFQGAAVASYAGSLDIAGISVELTANVTLAPALIYEVQLPSGTSVLGAAPVSFGSVPLGSNTTLNFLAVNRTTASLTMAAIGVAAGDFALVESSPGGTVLAPGQSDGFAIAFAPTAAGTRTAVLSIGSQQYTLTGTGVAPSFSLYQASCSTGQLVGAQFNFPTVYPNTAETAPFCLRNNTGGTQTVAVLSVSAGFTIPEAAAPMTLPANGSVQFTVIFQGETATGSYTGSLDAAGISVELTANVAPAPPLPTPILSVTLCAAGSAQCTAKGSQPGTVAVGFAAPAESGGSGTVTMSFAPLATGELDPGLGFAGGGLTAPFTFNTGDMAASFGGAAGVQFQTGTMAGTITLQAQIGGQVSQQSIAITVPPLPTPILSVTLCAAESAQCDAQSTEQGTVAVGFAAPAQTGGSGTVALSFESLPEAPVELDPGVAFAAGGNTANFTFNAGDTAANFGGAAGVEFQTGTTAGTITLLAQIVGSPSSQQSIDIAPALIGMTVAGTRQAPTVADPRQQPAVTVNVTGFDNARSARLLTITFYDAAGNAIPPGAIAYDTTGAFSAYFLGSGEGGQFMLSAYFPVLNGKPSQVSAFTVELANSVGTTASAQTSF